MWANWDLIVAYDCKNLLVTRDHRKHLSVIKRFLQNEQNHYTIWAIKVTEITKCKTIKMRKPDWCTKQLKGEKIWYTATNNNHLINCSLLSLGDRYTHNVSELEILATSLYFELIINLIIRVLKQKHKKQPNNNNTVCVYLL